MKSHCLWISCGVLVRKNQSNWNGRHRWISCRMASQLPYPIYSSHPPFLPNLCHAKQQKAIVLFIKPFSIRHSLRQHEFHVGLGILANLPCNALLVTATTRIYELNIALSLDAQFSLLNLRDRSLESWNHRGPTLNVFVHFSLLPEGAHVIPNLLA